MEWWYDLGLFQQILYCIAIPSTLILLAQVIMLLAGFGGGGEGVDFSDTSGLDSGGTDAGQIDVLDVDDISSDGDSITPGDFGVMSLFTLQGVMTFLTVFAWVAIILLKFGLFAGLVLMISAVAGFLAMWGVAWLIHISGKLQQNGTLNVNILIGEYATVYLPIPPNGYGYGKVTVQLAERFLECTAVSDDGPFPANSQVRVIDIRQGNVLVVEKV